MNKKTVSISLPQFRGVELKGATVDLEKGVVVAEYGEEEVKKDISETVMNAYSARVYLDIDILDDTFDDKLNALTQLMTIAEAWNKFDEFEADWDNIEQYKHFPMFEVGGDKFPFVRTSFAAGISDAHKSLFSFKTKKRAEQFGKQFIELFRVVLTN